ncbi:serine/threonine protein kinase [Acidobacteria bacterium AH-259-D05]|nr:serine/threonine protein kinase [Acidobacteria bacterium AH-259-D05]
MEKSYQERWEIIEPLGEGGQGIVRRVRDKNKFDLKKIARGLTPPSLTAEESQQLPQIKLFQEAILDLIRMDDPNTHGALKVLNPPEVATNPEDAEARLKREIETMAEVSHPNLLRIIDCRPEDHWFVSRFYSRGSLERTKPFMGDFVAALRAFRPLVEGVAKLHKGGLIHRDIKPQNIFIDDNNHLVLGDFGLVFSLHDEKTRLTEVGERVGTRDYMSPWAMRRSIEKLNPSFDVFSLGKTLYAMIVGFPCPFWYYDRDDGELEKAISDPQHFDLAHLLFSKCVVEEEDNCAAYAGELLAVIDQILKAIDGDAALIKGKMNRKCKVCANGSYSLVSDRDTTNTSNFGLKAGPTEFKIFMCKSCGHVQLFAFATGQDRKVWAE